MWGEADLKRFAGEARGRLDAIRHERGQLAADWSVRIRQASAEQQSGVLEDGQRAIDRFDKIHADEIRACESIIRTAVNLINYTIPVQVVVAPDGNAPT
jgi:hypothetical protein